MARTIAVGRCQHSTQEFSRLVKHVVDRLEQLRADHQILDASFGLDWEGTPLEIWAPAGYSVLGLGLSRVCIALCDQHVLKVQPEGDAQNQHEWEIYKGLAGADKELFCPPLAIEPRWGRWMLQERAAPGFGCQENSFYEEICERYEKLTGCEADLGTFGYLGWRLVALSWW